MDMLVFLVLGLLLTGFVTTLSVLGIATLHALVRTVIPARQPAVPVRVA